jgi:hypothetical protein
LRRDTPVLAAAEAAVADWQAEHPQAKLAELEAVVEGEVGRIRAWLLEQALARQAPSGPIPCPQCGAALQQRGTHRRTVQVPGPSRLTLQRAYAQCPTCGTGLFPPG